MYNEALTKAPDDLDLDEALEAGDDALDVGRDVEGDGAHGVTAPY
jgi:hypothetical protein